MKELSTAYKKVMRRQGKSTGRNKYYVNVTNEKDKEMMGVHLNKLEYKILNDDTSENYKDEIEEEIDDCRIEDGLTWVKECDQDETNMIFVSIGNH